MSDAQVLHFFVGKGGAGKSTLAAAYALRRSDEAPKERVLLVSTGPARGLSELLKRPLPAGPTRLVVGKGEGGLYAAELEPTPLLEPFVAQLVPALQKAALRPALLAEADLQALLAQSGPGLEELVALLQIAQWVEAGDYERVVVDTAPTAHTLRLLDLPQALRRYLGLVKGGLPGDKPAAGAARAKKEPAAPAEPPAAGGYLEDLVARLERLGALLRDPARAAFHLVTLGAPVSESQTRMFFTQLRERGLPVREILVNQVEDKTGCPTCQGRRGLQAPHVRKYQALDKNVPVHLLAHRELAPRGLDALRLLGKEWKAGKETKALEFGAAENPPALVKFPSMPPIAAPPLPPTRLIFFVGQGGVGKSSCAAAAAVTLTEKEGPVLLISTDPAHSLSDVLQSRLTDTETQVKGTKGLYARELDVVGWFNALRKRLKEKAEKAFEGAPKGGEVPADLALLRNLIDAAPSGIDELAALSCLTDALVQERFKRIVVDPSPATSSVRVVELAPVAREWFGLLAQVLGKYRTKGLGELADEMAALVKHVQRFEAALASPSESRFVVVTRGEETAAARTERLVDYLKGRKLQVERVLVNRVVPKSTCDKCENRRKNELLAAKALEKKLGLPITVAPALGRHPAGLRELKTFRTAWYALSAAPAKIKAA